MCWQLVFMMKSKISNFLNKVKRLFNSRKQELTCLQDFYYTISQKRIVVFDTETTGLDTLNDDIIQIAAIEINKGIVGRDFERFFATDKDLCKTKNIHNISNETLLQKATDKRKGLNDFIYFLSNDALLAHNIKYDFSILNSNLLNEGLKPVKETNNSIFCSLSLTRQLYSLSSYKLVNILKSLKIKGVNSHDALDDTKATVQLAFVLKEKIEKLNSDVYNAQE
jgi:DNA helicase II / ATP-dependent DNA helicase PcrA